VPVRDSDRNLVSQDRHRSLDSVEANATASKSQLELACEGDGFWPGAGWKTGFSLPATIGSWRPREHDVDALVGRVVGRGDALARERTNVATAP